MHQFVNESGFSVFENFNVLSFLSPPLSELIVPNHNFSPFEEEVVAMKRAFLSAENQVSVDAMDPNSVPSSLIPHPNFSTDFNSFELHTEGLTRRAAMYQDYMKQIPIPTKRGSVIPFASWIGLGKSIKQLYGQPLHYLTNVALMQWDQLRIGSEDEWKPLDDIVHPCKGEASVWLMEEIHRQTSSHFHIANLWKKDPMYSGFIDSIFPKLEHTS